MKVSNAERMETFLKEEITLIKTVRKILECDLATAYMVVIEDRAIRAVEPKQE